MAFDVPVAPDLTVRVQREDLDEMLGNLLDNARKWGRFRVTISATANGSSVDIIVDDDGRGLAEAMRAAVLQRGVSADEAAPGSGLGLAVVRDLPEVYGLDRPGGLARRGPQSPAATAGMNALRATRPGLWPCDSPP